MSVRSNVSYIIIIVDLMNNAESMKWHKFVIIRNCNANDIDKC